ncbi:cation:proton antiporter [Fodinicurvata sp. EGI_FJ10296]|uniref:cation:proton antiporter n=1 Tax=Fodinicurvata sp. EGI_FJ10296 TaxID=3231908 RepID=UPI0034545456
MPIDNTFYEIAALVLLASAIGLVGLMLRQPLVVSFIAVGVIAGPGVLGIAQSTEYIHLLSEISIAVLLFLVGLKLDMSLVRTLGPVALATGLGQVTFTAVFGFAICVALGIDWLTAIYVSIALTFSSTIIIVKLLSDKREIDSLHGRIALGFLIVQDIVVVLAMVTLSALGVGVAGDGGAGDVLGVILYGIAAMAFVAAFIRWVAEPVMRMVSRSPELMVIFAVGWAAGFASIGDLMGFGKELGGLLAGVSLATTQYRDAIGSRLGSLRDFLLLFFFLSLGLSMDLGTLGGQVAPALVLSVFVLVGNPLIVLAIMSYMGYRKRTGFLAGLTVAQISEFSLIFMAMGVTIGHVTEESLGLVTLVGLVTIALSTYMITYSHHLYGFLERWLTPFERRHAFREEGGEDAAASHGNYDFILFGLGRYGREIGDRLAAHGYRILGVDFDPEALRAWRKAGHKGCFGDATDPEFASHLPLSRVRAVIAAVPRTTGGLTDADPRMALLHGLRSQGFHGRIALAMHTPTDSDALKRQGADIILTPFADAAEFAVAAMEKVLAEDRDRPV